MVEQAAGGPIGGVHRAQEAPGVGQQLAHGRGAHLGEEGAPVNGPEVRYVPAGMRSELGPDSGQICGMQSKVPMLQA